MKKTRKIAEKVFRDYYVSLYPKDKPISEMTSLEQGMYNQTLFITTMIVEQVEAELKKVIRIDEGKINKILNKTSGCSTNCISCKELAKVISDHSAEILEFGGEG